MSRSQLKRGRLTRRPATVVGLRSNPHSELIRWIMARTSVPFDEQLPELFSKNLTICSWRSNALDINQPIEVLEYIDAAVPEDVGFLAHDESEREWLNTLVGKLGGAVSYVTRATHLEGDITYKWWDLRPSGVRKRFLKLRLRRKFRTKLKALDAAKDQIKSIFDRVSTEFPDLAQVPEFLALCISAITAPLLIPAKYKTEVLAEGHAEITAFGEELRATLVGQWALQTYDEHRDFPKKRVAFGTELSHPASTTPMSKWRYFISRIIGWFTGPAVQRFVFRVLRAVKPVLVIRKFALVTKHVFVKEAIERDLDFTIAEVNAPNMLRLNGPFFLGMDRSPRYSVEHTATSKAVQRDDATWLRELITNRTDEVINVALQHGSVDVVSQVIRPSVHRVIGDYFGVSGPDEITTMRWYRALFHDLFLNLTGDRKIRIPAEEAYSELRAYLLSLIAACRSELGDHPSPPAEREDLLTRLIKLQIRGEIELSDDGIRRNISGLVVGAMETTCKASTSIIRQMLKRSDVLAMMREANDHETKLGLCLDALRFDPTAPFLRRYNRHPSSLGDVELPAGASVLLATASAMFDPSAWEQPNKIVANRDPKQYMLFGDGLHRCFGEYINWVQIPVIVDAVLSLDNVRLLGPYLEDGPFPDQFVLGFTGRRSKEKAV